MFFGHLVILYSGYLFKCILKKNQFFIIIPKIKLGSFAKIRVDKNDLILFIVLIEPFKYGVSVIDEITFFLIKFESQDVTDKCKILLFSCRLYNNDILINKLYVSIFKVDMKDIFVF
mgnify:CR=1 FL=1